MRSSNIINNAKPKNQLVKLIAICLLICAFITLSLIICHKKSYSFFSKSLNNGQMIVATINSNKIMLGSIYFHSSKGEALKIKIDKNKSEDQQLHPHMFRKKYIPTHNDKPKVALIIMDLGLNKTATLQAFTLDKRIGLGFTPYINNAAEWIDNATQQGFETYINIPLQSGDYPIHDPGPYALLNNLSLKENMRKLEWALSKSKKIVGVYTSPNDVYTNSKVNVLPFLEHLKKRNLGLVYSNASNLQIIENFSKQLQLDYVDINIDLDSDLSEIELKNNLYNLENMAKVRGFVVGKFNVYPFSMQIISKWIEQLQEVELVPVSYTFELNRAIHLKDSNVNGVSESIEGIPEISLPSSSSNADDSLIQKLQELNIQNPNLVSEEEYKRNFSRPVEFIREGKTPEAPGEHGNTEGHEGAKEHTAPEGH